MRNIVMLNQPDIEALLLALQGADRDERTVRICCDTNDKGERYIQWKIGEGMWTFPRYSATDWNNPADSERLRSELNSREPMFEAIGERMVIVNVSD